MGALKGSLSYVRLFVQGELPADFQDTFVRRIRLRAMKPLDPLEDALERSGWCSLEKPFDTDLDYEKVFFNNFVNLGFRTDRWAIPSPLLKVKLEEAEAAYLKKKGREKIGRNERQELKDMVAKKLRREVAPVMRVVDLSWSLEEGIVRFFSHGQKPIGLVVELFEKTFALKLDIESPYVTAARRGLSKEDSRAFERLEPVSFASFAATAAFVEA